jgi:predicted dehydrogenase
MIDIGVIGTGKMGENHARILSSMKGVNTVYVYDVDGARSRSIADKYEDCLVSDSLESLLDCVSAVTIVTPTKTHHKIAVDVIERGIHLLIEKPICKNTQQSLELCEKVSGTSIINGVGHVERFNPVVGVLKTFIKKPSHVSILRHNPVDRRDFDVNVVEDLMIHDIDIINFLLEIDHNNVSVASCGDDDSFSVMLCYDYPIYLSASRKSTKKTRTIYIDDEDYTIEADLLEQTVHVYQKPNVYNLFVQSSVVGRLNLQKLEPLREELTCFVDCVTNGTEFPIPFEHGHYNLAVCESILRLNNKDFDPTKEEFE